MNVKERFIYLINKEIRKMINVLQSSFEEQKFI